MASPPRGARFGSAADPIRLDATLLGGQAFRWRADGDGFLGVVAERQVRMTPLADGAVRVQAAPAWDAASVSRYFRLGPDYADALAAFRKDAALAPAVDAYAGLRLLDQDPWETLVAFVTSANNNVKRISLTLERLAAAAGAPQTGPWGPFHAFPSPDAVAALDEAALRALGFGYRAPLLRVTAERVARGDVDLVALREDADLEDARAALLTLPGVGPKVAECVALFALAKPDAFPVDRWVARIVGDAYFGGRAVTPADLGAFARERWGARAGLAQQFLFHAARLAGRTTGASPRHS